ncbi:hypothetical protein GI482_07130 [Bacillus sp. N3536]|nr:hypothetical protein GI482_07130 [Bacillus sp. N3536]
MKTLRDLEELKNKPISPLILFGSAYEFLMERLADYIISKTDGEERIENELKDWDNEAQYVIKQEVRKRVSLYLESAKEI